MSELNPAGNRKTRAGFSEANEFELIELNDQAYLVGRSWQNMHSHGAVKSQG